MIIWEKSFELLAVSCSINIISKLWRFYLWKLTSISLLKPPIFSLWTHVPDSSVFDRDRLRSMRITGVLGADWRLSIAGEGCRLVEPEVDKLLVPAWGSPGGKEWPRKEVLLGRWPPTWRGPPGREHRESVPRCSSKCSVLKGTDGSNSALNTWWSFLVDSHPQVGYL